MNPLAPAAAAVTASPVIVALDFPDAVIAATAMHHGLELVTLNLKHFPMFPDLQRPY